METSRGHGRKFSSRFLWHPLAGSGSWSALTPIPRVWPNRYARRFSKWRLKPVVTNVRTMDQLLAQSISRPRFNAFLLTSLGWLAVALAFAGIYAMLSFFVAQSRHEIG